MRFNKITDSNSDENGVSPVIGVILMVAITVALVALVTVIVFDFGSDVSESPDATVQFEETDSEVQATILRNSNVDQFKLQSPDGSIADTASGSVGGVLTDSSKSAGKYSIIAVMPDGREEVLTSTDVEESASTGGSTGESITGTVSVNPDLDGATVYAYENGSVVDSATVSDGSYELTVSDRDDASIVVNTDGDVNYKGNPFYASAKQEVSGQSSVDFTFSNSFETQVNNSQVTVSYEIDQKSGMMVGNAHQLQAINQNNSESYDLVRDIDASNTQLWNNNEGFDPFDFGGTINGNNNSINNISINRDGTNFVGVISENSGTIKNVNVNSVDVIGDSPTGGLVGDNGGTIKNVTVSGTVSGAEEVGGIAGQNSGTINKVLSRVSVSGDYEVGGIAGYGSSGLINNSYSTNSVSGTGRIGGIAGSSSNTITNSYARGDVSGSSKVGGILGENALSATVSDSYWDTETTGQSSSAVLSDSNGLTTSEMQGSSAETNMAGFDFADVWVTQSSDYPVLQVNQNN